MSPQFEDFKKALELRLATAKEQGAEYIDISSKELHMMVGGYPSKSHRMPECCRVMRQMVGANDVVLESPPKGNGATLKIRYYV